MCGTNFSLFSPVFFYFFFALWIGERGKYCIWNETKLTTKHIFICRACCRVRINWTNCGSFCLDVRDLLITIVLSVRFFANLTTGFNLHFFDHWICFSFCSSTLGYDISIENQAVFVPLPFGCLRVSLGQSNSITFVPIAFGGKVVPNCLTTRMSEQKKKCSDEKKELQIKWKLLFSSCIITEKWETNNIW